MFHFTGDIEKNNNTHTPQLVVFYHLTLVGHYRERTRAIIEALDSSGLLQALDHFFVVVVTDSGDYLNHMPELPEKAEVILVEKSVNVHEGPTIHLLHQYCIQNPDVLVMYLHCKGATRELINQPVNDWIKLLLYFTVTLWEGIPETLQDHVVSCPNVILTNNAHCSGNFWWARGDYIAKLPVFGDNVERHLWEYWVGTNLNEANPACILWPNSVNHYVRLFPSTEYDYITKANCMKVYPDCVSTACDQSSLYGQ